MPVIEARLEGTVHALVQGKGYGFMLTPDGEKFFFMRRDLRPNSNGMQPMPMIGARVTFVRVPITKTDERGRKMSDQAVDVEVVE